MLFMDLFNTGLLKVLSGTVKFGKT